MKNRFETAVSKLVKAFFDGTLSKGNCSACAVGNMCDGYTQWFDVFGSDCIDGPFTKPENYNGYAQEVIDKTGYTWRELASVEKAFESNTLLRVGVQFHFTKKQIMQDQYNGLMAVVDVLCDIEGIEATETKKLFEYA